MNNNFYFNIPSELDVINGDLIRWNGKKKIFDRFFVKAGEAIKQTVEERSKQEMKNGKGMHTLYQFYLPVDKIKNAYSDKRDKGFDSLIFGHQSLHETFNNTIFACFRSKAIDKKDLDFNFNYGREYIDISSDINLWLKDNPSKANLIKDYPEIGMIFNVVEEYFQSVMPGYLKAFAERKLDFTVEKSIFKFRDYQAKVYDMIVDLFKNGSKQITAELPPRWGKTKTMLKLFADSSCKMMVVVSYTKSVNESYRKAIIDTDFGHNEDMQFVSANNKHENLSNIDPSRKTVIVLNTACDMKCWKKRTENFNEIIKLFNPSNDDILFVNEEADFGNHTDNSAMKIEDLGINSESYVLSITGTDAYKADNVFENADHIVVNLMNWNEIHCLGINRKAIISK